MLNCPPNTFFSAFVDSCIDCPKPLENCYQESNEDLLSCSKSCTAQPPRQSSGDGDTTALVLQIVIPIAVFAGIVAVILLKLYLKYGNRRGNRESGSEAVENPNGSSQLVSIPPRNQATESEELQNDAASTFLGTPGVLSAVDKHASNETLSEHDLLV